MDSFIDVRLKPDAEMREAELSSKVFTKFHKALVSLGTKEIGISFPEVHLKLGKLFRFHGTESALRNFEQLDWLGALSGYCKVSAIAPVPDNVQYRVISSKRGNMSKAKLRRLVARGSIDKEGEKRYKVKMLSQGFDNPYLDIYSSSTEQMQRKFFDFSGIQGFMVTGEFDSYGLSKKATVPWF